MAAVLPLDKERDRFIKGKSGDLPPEPKITDGDVELEEQPDGSAIVNLNPKKKEQEAGGFDDNLADGLIDETALATISRELMEKVEYDKLARQKRDLQYEEGLRRTGLGEDAPGGAAFSGASRVTHPMLTEACVDFYASAMKELMPPAGPVKTHIVPDMTPERLKIADRQQKYMNWQLVKQIPEFRDELAVTMTQLPMGGSQYLKAYPNEEEQRACVEFVPIEDLLLPYGCNNFWSAHRITHVQRIGEQTFEERVDSGMYREIEFLSAPAETPETSKTAAAVERIEGVEQPPQNIDGLRLIYEINCYLKLDIDQGRRLPYLVSIDERTEKVLSIYRNWEETDKRKKRLHWIADFNFIPWRGAYKMGLAQMLAGLSAAATGSLRALLDSALVQTIPVLAKMKGAKFGSQSKTVDPMQILEIEAGVGMDDIRKALMALPFNQPSPVLYALLGWLTETAKGVVTTAEEKIADAGNQMPMGTALALMESGAKVFSTIHTGLHHSMARVLEIIARINKTYGVDEEGQQEEFGEVICTTEDFAQPLGVMPVSDPNIFSEAQRGAQNQMLLQNAQGVDPKTMAPTALGKLHDLYAVVRRVYEQAKIPNIDEILPPPKKPTELNAAAENSAVMLGTPVMAFPEQNHLAHLETHMRFVTDPLLGGNPAAVPSSWPQMIEHIKQHLSFLYAKTMHDLASEALGMDLSEAMQDREQWNRIDDLLAAASRVAHEKLTQILEPLGPTMTKMIQKIEAMKPPAPMDPSQSAITIAKMEDARSREEHKDETQLSAAELEAKKKKDEADAAAKAEANRIKDKDVSARAGVAADKTAIDAARFTHDQTMDRAGAQREAADMQHRHTTEKQDLHHRHASEAVDMQHRHGLEQRGAAREDASAAHGQRMDVADHRLKTATAADSSMQAADDHRLRQSESAHDRLMDISGHAENVRQGSHSRQMDVADHNLRATEHVDNVKQQEKTRKADGDRHKAELKVKAKAASKPPAKPKKR